MTLHHLTQIGFRPDDPQFVLDLLKAMGLTVPDASAGAAADARIKGLNAARFGFSEQQVDAALDETELARTDRMIAKRVLFNNGLMRRQS